MSQLEVNDKLFRIALGNHLQKLRKQHKLTMAQLAFEIHSSERYVSMFESGEKNISAKFIGRIAWALNIPPSELFNFEMPKMADVDFSESSTTKDE